jgi:anti-sigma regulatory factor (Ser/Thr protein kinase)
MHPTRRRLRAVSPLVPLPLYFRMSDNIRPAAAAQFSLADDPHSVTRARRLLARVLDDTGVDGDTRSNALLVASELVTNAIRHGSNGGDEISLTYTVTPDGHLSICVRDSIRSGSVPRALPPDEGRSGGRGLKIVEHLADWSERVVDGRREVCAELQDPRH